MIQFTIIIFARFYTMQCRRECFNCSQITISLFCQGIFVPVLYCIAFALYFSYVFVVKGAIFLSELTIFSSDAQGGGGGMGMWIYGKLNKRGHHLNFYTTRPNLHTQRFISYSHNCTVPGISVAMVTQVFV